MWPISRPDRLQCQPKSFRSELLKSDPVRLGLVVDHDGNGRAVPRSDRVVFEIKGLAGGLALDRIKNMTPRSTDRLNRRILVRLCFVTRVRGLRLCELLLKPLVGRD